MHLARYIAHITHFSAKMFLHGVNQCTDVNRNLHIRKIRFLFPVLFTVEYQLVIAEFSLYVGFGANLLKMWSPEPEYCQNRNPHISKMANYFRFVSQTIGVEATTFLSHMQNLVQIRKES